VEQDDVLKMKIQSIRKITHGPHLNLFEISYQDADDQKRSWRVASRHDEPKCATGRFDEPDAVVIVPYHVDKHKLVIIKEFRIPLGHYQYGFPAGLLDLGETIEQATVRELYEETGLAVTRIIRISPPIYSSSGLTDESISIVYVKCQGEPSRQANTSSEEIHTLLVSPNEAAQLCGQTDLMFDVKTWLVLSEYAKSGNIF
jgi:ADP-ribose pyrophosphatase